MSYEAKNGNGTTRVRSQLWSVVLYDYEDPNHKYIYEWVKRSYEFVSIMHIKANENEPKTHRHLMFKTSTAYTIKGIIRLMGGLIEHVEPVESRDAYLQYMCHRSPACWVEFQKGDTSKREYPITDMEGSIRWIQSIEQKAHFVQLENIVADVNKGYSILEHIQRVGSQDGEKVLDFLRSNQFIIPLLNQHCSVIRQRDVDNGCANSHYYAQLRESLGEGDIANEL